ncbi:MAG: TGS domain-containing protein [Acidimicrobiales bacterium]
MLTPTGDVLTLPAGAGVIDFAYAIHSEVGHRCSGAKVNGRLVPLSSRLRSGDRVEILTNRTTGPSLDWLAYTATARARDRVRQWHGRASGRRARPRARRRWPRCCRKHRTGTASVSGLLLATAGLSTWEQLCDQVGSGHVELIRLERALRGRGEHEPSPDDAPDEESGRRAAGRSGRDRPTALAVAPEPQRGRGAPGRLLPPRTARPAGGGLLPHPGCGRPPRRLRQRAASIEDSQAKSGPLVVGGAGVAGVERAPGVRWLCRAPSPG